MRNRYFLSLIIFLLVQWISTACNPGLKMTNREVDTGTSTLTPFASKATFTATNTPLDISGEGSVDNPSFTATLEPTSQLETTERVVSTPSSTPTLKLSPAVPSTTPTTTKTSPPSATSVPSQVSATPVPGQPTVTYIPPVPTDTPIPPTATSAPPPTQTPAGCTYSGNSNYENQVVVLINQERTDRGLSELTLNSSLRQAAQRHSKDMACNDFFSHTGSDGSSPFTRMIEAGYSYSWAAENIAASSSQSFSAQAVVNMWMNSTGHRNNILSENATHIGVGFRYAGDSNSQDFDAYYTANFGRP
jgi:uncharacterized protein YkwD